METFTSHCTSSASPFVEQNPLDLWDSTSVVCAFRALLSFLLLWLVAELLPPVLLSEVGKVHSLWKDHSQLRRESKPLLDAVGVTVEPYNFEINDAFFFLQPSRLEVLRSSWCLSCTTWTTACLFWISFLSRTMEGHIVFYCLLCCKYQEIKLYFHVRMTNILIYLLTVRFSFIHIPSLLFASPR